MVRAWAFNVMTAEEGNEGRSEGRSIKGKERKERVIGGLADDIHSSTAAASPPKPVSNITRGH